MRLISRQNKKTYDKSRGERTHIQDTGRGQEPLPADCGRSRRHDSRNALPDDGQQGGRGGHGPGDVCQGVFLLGQIPGRELHLHLALQHSLPSGSLVHEKEKADGKQGEIHGQGTAAELDVGARRGSKAGRIQSLRNCGRGNTQHWRKQWRHLSRRTGS